MKKFLSIIFITALSFAAITACTKETETLADEQIPVEESGINITIIAGDKNLDDDPSKTKTYVSEESDGVHIYWDVKDQLRVYEIIGDVDAEDVTHYAVSHYATSSYANVSSGGKTAIFQTNITGDITGAHDSYIYTAIYPASCADKSGENYRVYIPGTQNLTGDSKTNLATNADVLVGEPINNGNTRIKDKTELEYRFKRYGTTVKMTLKGITAGEKLRKVEITAPKSMAGYGYVDLTTGKITKTEGTSKKMTLNVDDAIVDGTGNIPVWFRVLSNTWKATESDPIQVAVTTNKATYSKEIKSAELVFAEGGLTTFGISNLGASRQDIQELPNGDYVITSSVDGNNYIMMAYASGNNIPRETYILNEDQKIVVDNGNAEKCIYTFTCVSDGDYKGCYTIMDYNGKYLYAAGTGDNNYLRADALDSANPQFFWVYTGDGGLQAKSANRNILMYNANNSCFSCYNGGQKPISVVSADNVVVVRVPKIIVSANTLTLDAAGKNKGEDITVTGVNLTAGGITTTVDDSCDWLLAEVEDDILVVYADPNSGEERNTNITLSSEGATSVVIAVTQKSNKNEIEINTDNSGVTGSYADKTFDVDGITFGFTQWMKNTNIQAKKSITNSLYNVDAIPAPITKITFVQTGEARAIKVYGGTTEKPTTEITAPATAATMVFNFTGKDYTYFSMTTPGYAVYFDKIVIEYAEPATLTAVTVSGEPDKKKYLAGDEFNPIGLIVTGTYSDGSNKNITEGITWNCVPETLSVGTKKVSVTATVGEKTSPAHEVDVTVSAKVDVTEISLSKSTLTLINKTPVQLVATVSPDNASNKNVTWTSSDGNIATVDKDGYVSAKAAGTATITATSADNTKISATCNVTVNAYTVTLTQPVTPSGITIDADLKEDVFAGEEVTLSYSGVPTGWQFKSWSVKAGDEDVPVTDNKFTMPAKNVTVSAEFEQPEDATYFYESFNQCAGTGGNDGKWSGTIASSALTADNNGWTFVNEGGANTCAKFGSGSKQGSAETPEINISTMTAKLMFKAAAWDGSSEGTTLMLSATGATLSSSSVTLVKAAWTSYTINLIDITGPVKIKFKAEKSSNNRFFLDEVYVYYGSTPTPPQPATYTVTVDDSIENGKVTASTTSATAGTEITLTATPSEGYEFGSWDVKDASNNSVTVTDNKFTMPASDVTVSATFKEAGGGDTPAVGTVLWGEDFKHFGTNTPSAAGTGTGTTIYGDATISYNQSNENTKGYNENSAGGTAPELLLSKNNQTWTISGIPCAGVTEMSLTFLSNRTTFEVSSSTTGITVDGSQKSWTIANSGTETFTLVIKNKGSNNARIDDVVLKVTAN